MQGSTVLGEFVIIKRFHCSDYIHTSGTHLTQGLGDCQVTYISVKCQKCTLERQI